MPKTVTHAKKNKKTMKAKTKSTVKAKKRNIVPFVLVGVLVLSTALFLTQLQQQQQTISKAAGGDCTVSDADMQENPQEQEFLKLINDYRASNGAGPLTLSKELKKPAEWYSNEQAKNYLDGTHNDALGRTPEQRYVDCGVTIKSSDAENKLYGDATAADAFNTWKNSPGHNENMLDPNSKQIGIGITGDTWVTVFSGDPPPATDQNAVPSPNCLGDCPTASVSASPSISPATSPTASASSKVTVPTNFDANANSPLGILVLFLQLILKLFSGGF